MKSHSLRGSVDWNMRRIANVRGYMGHSLRGSVDWNNEELLGIGEYDVTPYAEVWIEICTMYF